VEGAADLEGIWRLGAEEDYTVNLADYLHGLRSEV